jgi:hypothetical protein
MKGKGILWVYGALLVLLSWVVPVSAAETADEITTMLTWWDEFGSDWEKAEELIEFAGTEDMLYLLADNTVEKQNEQQQQ